MIEHAHKYLTCAAALAIGLSAGLFIGLKPARPSAAVQPDRAERPPAIKVAAPAPAPASVREIASQAYVLPDSALPTAAAPPPVARMDRDAVLALADRCAPSEPATVLASIVKVESGYDPLKIGVNGPRPVAYRPPSRQEAIALAARLIASGQSVDLGLAQINSRNLGWLGLPVEAAFDPCRNLAAAARIMTNGYKAALKTSPPGRPLLHTAYSIYNTGDPDRGVSNGYAARVESAKRR